MPPIPIFELIMGTVLVVGVVYYFGAERGRINREKVEADAATGEIIIG